MKIVNYHKKQGVNETISIHKKLSFLEIEPEYIGLHSTLKTNSHIVICYFTYAMLGKEIPLQYKSLENAASCFVYI